MLTGPETLLKSTRIRHREAFGGTVAELADFRESAVNTVAQRHGSTDTCWAAIAVASLGTGQPLRWDARAKLRHASLAFQTKSSISA
jgi:hypothetical protein